MLVADVQPTYRRNLPIIMPSISIAIRYATGGCAAKADVSTDTADEVMLDGCCGGDDVGYDGVAPATLRSRMPSSWTCI